MPMVLTLNAGSSSVEFALFDAAVEDGPMMATGQIDGLGSHATFTARYFESGQRESYPLQPAGPADHARAVNAILDWIETRLAGRRVAAVGHRVVHGGPDHAAPARIDDRLIEDLRALTRWPHCISRTIWKALRPPVSSSLTCRRSPVSIPRFIAVIRS